MSSSLGLTFQLDRNTLESLRETTATATATANNTNHANNTNNTNEDHLEMLRHRPNEVSREGPDESFSIVSVPLHEEHEDSNPFQIDPTDGIIPLEENDSNDNTEEEDWNEMIPLPRCALPLNSDSGNVSDDNESSDDEQGGELDNISLSPPPSLPLVIINLEELCGHVPSDPAEAKEMMHQVRTALLNDDDDADDNDNDQQPEQEKSTGEALSRHFDARVQELFDTGVAFHSDTATYSSTIMDETHNESSGTTSTNDNNRNHKFAVVPYPPYFCRKDRLTVVVTERQWKKLLRPHKKIPVVSRLLAHLSACSRSLSWKIDMHDELRHMANAEERCRHQRTQNFEYRTWRTERRKKHLDKLYQVRETFDHKRTAAQDKLEQLEQTRDQAVRSNVRQLRYQQQQQQQQDNPCNNTTSDKEHTGGIEALDFDSTMPFHIDTPIPNNKNDKSVAEESSSSGDDDDDGYVQSESESDNDDGETGDGSVDADTNAHNVSANGARPQARLRAAAKRRHRKHQAQRQVEKRAWEQSKIKQAQAEEERLTDTLTTPEQRMVQAVVTSLEERMTQIDDLLESLQEEEWADEEDGVVADTAVEIEIEESASGTGTATAKELTLLDQILAMILGELPCLEKSDLENHYKYISKEHKSIVEEWKAHFGRLPVSLGAKEGEDVSPVAESTCQDDNNRHGDVYDLQEQIESIHMDNSPFGMPNHAAAAAATATILAPSAEAMRHALGISENDVEDDWDDVANWDEIVPPALPSVTAATAAALGKDPRHRVVAPPAYLELEPFANSKSAPTPSTVMMEKKKATQEVQRRGGFRPGGKAPRS